MTSEIVIGTEFERTHWEELSFNPSNIGGVGSNHPTRLMVGLAIDADEYGNISTIADTRNKQTYKVLDLKELHSKLTSFTEHLDVMETTGHFLYKASDMDCLLKLLPTEAAEKLVIHRRVVVDGLQIWFSPNTKLTLRKNKYTVKIFALENPFTPGKEL